MTLHKSSYRYFQAVAESRSIREAADRLRISQSAVSRQIQNLETEMGCALFDRSVRGVVLTAAGQVLQRFVRDSNVLTDRLKIELDMLKGIQRGHLVVAVVEGFATNGFPEVLTCFSQQHPEVTLEVLVEGTNMIISAIEGDTCDIGVVYNPRSPHVTIVEEVRAPLCALMAPDHPLARRGSVRMEELLGYPLVVPAGKGGSREVFEAARRVVRAPFHPVLETNSSHVAQAFLRTSNGVGILSARSAAPYLRQGVIVAVPMAEAHLFDGLLAVVTPPARTLSSAGEILLSMICKSLRLLAGAEAR